MGQLESLGFLIAAISMAALGAGFFWFAGKRLFQTIFGPEPPATRMVINNHPPPGHFAMSTPKGFSILPIEAPAERRGYERDMPPHNSPAERPEEGA